MNSMCTFHAFVLAAFVVMLAPEVDAAPPSFLRKVSIQEVQMDLQATLSTLLQDTSASATRRLQVIEASTWQTFQALPKNTVGRLAPPAVRYLVHGYFAKEHGWLIKGLEPHGMQLNITEMHDVNVLKDKAPLLVEGLLEARQADRGLSFNDIVTMVAVLEQMMFDDSMALLEAAYRLNGLSVQDEIDTALLHKVMQSYLVLFGQGSTADLYDVERHKKILESRKTEVQEFEHDTVLNYQFERRHTTNAFKPSLYSFKAAAEIMEVLAQNYGKWQNSECRDMKDHLTDLDPDGFGEVPLSRFYAQKPGSTYHFSESADYLRSTGALDETSPGNPKVYIANYIAGPSNCIATSSYYSVCCLSECAGILAELEHHIAAPLASPEKLLALIHLVSDTVLSHGLIEKLHAIADRHSGEVPLHGRLFAQWLHFAFPHECPYPSIVQSATALTATQWLDGQSIASAKEREEHIASVSAGASPSAGALDIDGRWSDHEVLPVLEPTSTPFLQFAASSLRSVMQVVAIVVALRSALAAWRGVASTGDEKAKKNDDFSGSLHV